jgi:hypothetical protein
MDPKQEWEKLRQEILSRIHEIDAATGWASVEPDWWLHMQDVARAAAKWRAAP